MPPINPTSIRLNDFTRLADLTTEAKQDTTYLKISDGQLAKAGGFRMTFFTLASTKRATIEAFVGALREKYGSRIADLINTSHLSALREAGRPLTARLVKDVTAQARKLVNAHNLETVEKFLRKDSERGLDSAVKELCAKEGLTSTEDQYVLRNRLAMNLMNKAGQGGFHPDLLTPEVLHGYIADGASLTNICSENEFKAIFKSQTLAGTLDERLQLADMGVGKNSGLAFSRAVAELDSPGRRPHGKALTPAVDYELIFKQPPAPGLDADDKILADIDERCDKDMADLLGRLRGNEKDKLRQSVAMCVSMMPWAKLASLAERPNKITLDDAPKATAFITGQRRREDVEHYLNKDIPRVATSVKIGENIQELPAPTYAFQLPGGETKSLRVGRGTDFQFENAADKEAYLSGQDNSLARSLKSLCRDVCGPEAAEAQVVNAMSCLTQLAKSPLRFVSPLAGASFNEHSNVSVSLSRQADGSVRADFSTPEEKKAQDALGHFKMSLTIARDGRMTVTEFELSPRLEVVEARNNEAMRLRIDQALDMAKPLCSIQADEWPRTKLADRLNIPRENASPEQLYQARFRKAPPPGLHPGGMLAAVSHSLNDSLNNEAADGLTAQIQTRARAIDPEAKVVGRFWLDMEDIIADRISTLVRTRPVFTEQDVREARERVLDEFFGAPDGKLHRAAAEIPEAQRQAFVRGCLELGRIPDQALLAATRQMAGTVTKALGGILKARDGSEALEEMHDLALAMGAAAKTNPDFAHKGADFFMPAMLLAMRLGLADYMGRESPEALVETLARPGPFRDMIYDAEHTAGLSDSVMEKRELAGSACTWLLSSLTGLLPDEAIQTLSKTRERDLSLPRQRERLDEGQYAVRGVDVAAPELKSLNDVDDEDAPELKGPNAGVMSRDMPKIKEFIHGLLTKDLLNGPDSSGMRTQSGLSYQFGLDFPRDGVFVNGRFHHPLFTETSEQGFIALFPDARTAGLLSNLATQALLGTFQDALVRTKARTLDAILPHTFLNMDMEHAQEQHHTRIDALNADQGLYRVSSFFYRVSSRPESAVERYMYSVAAEVDLGAPVTGEGPQPLPRVTDVQVDFLIRGRQAVPGER